MGCSQFNTETNKKKTHVPEIRRLKISSYETKSPAKNLQISSCSIATLSHVCNYKLQFCAFKGDAQNLPLEELVGGRSPPQQFPEVNMYVLITLSYTSIVQNFEKNSQYWNKFLYQYSSIVHNTSISVLRSSSTGVVGIQKCTMLNFMLIIWMVNNHFVFGLHIFCFELFVQSYFGTSFRFTKIKIVIHFLDSYKQKLNITCKIWLPWNVFINGK